MSVVHALNETHRACSSSKTTNGWRTGNGVQCFKVSGKSNVTNISTTTSLSQLFIVAVDKRSVADVRRPPSTNFGELPDLLSAMFGSIATNDH